MNAPSVRTHLASPGALPFFIIGSARSGTTALSRALHEHSRLIIATGQNPILPLLGKTAYQFGCAPTATRYQRYTALTPDGFRHSLRHFCFDCVWGSADSPAPQQPKLNEYSRTKHPSFLKWWGARASANEQAATGLSWLFPGTKFVYLVRNGVDVVFSMSKFSVFRRMSFDQRCQFWADNVLRYQYLQSRADSLAIRFEVFVNDPDSVLAEIFAHLDLPIEDGPSALASGWLIHPLDGPTVKMSAREVLASRPPAHLTWSVSEKNAFRSICGKAMELLDYKLPF
jgi:hypothetical protein